MIIQTQKSHETLIKQNKTKQNKNGTDHFSREVNYSVLCNRVALMDFFLMKIGRMSHYSNSTRSGKEQTWQPSAANNPNWHAIWLSENWSWLAADTMRERSGGFHLVIFFSHAKQQTMLFENFLFNLSLFFRVGNQQDGKSRRSINDEWSQATGNA